jgi:bifunctional non-homologous end joining protein LigD
LRPRLPLLSTHHRPAARLGGKSARLRCKSCVIDGEAVPCGADGRSNFDFIRYRQHDLAVFLYAFDLLQLGVDDLRRDPLGVRKATLQSALSNAGPGIRYNEHIEGDAEDIFRHACKLRLEGIVSKLRRSPYRSGRSPHWIKLKNPDCDAVGRETEEDWGSRPRRAGRAP